MSGLEKFILLLVFPIFQENYVLHVVSALKAAKYDDAEFNLRVVQSPHFVMFYAPWCGHCKRLQPLWDKFAEEYGSQKSQLTVAKVDCTQDTPLCAREDIKAYPTLRLFHDGNKSTYRGNRNIEDLQHFVRSEMTIEIKGAEKTPESEVDFSKMDKSDLLEETRAVIEWNDDTFEQGIASGLHFVEFYAPWCPYCQKLTPIWEDLGSSYTFTDTISIGKVDCTKYKKTCENQNIAAYPSLVVYSEGKKVEEYTGHRSFENLMDFCEKIITKYKHISEPLDGEKEGKDGSTLDSPEQTEVTISLNKENFDLALRSGKVFVDFYAPWCIHCQKLAPTWEKLAVKALVDGGGIATIAKVDCTIEEDICQKYQITSFPTLILFWTSSMKEVYQGPRTLEAMYRFVQRNAHDEL